MNFALFQDIKKTGNENKDALLYALANLTVEINNKKNDYQQLRSLTSSAFKKINDVHNHFKTLKQNGVFGTGSEAVLQDIINSVYAVKSNYNNEALQDQEFVHNGIIAALNDKKKAVEAGLNKMGFVVKNRQCALTLVSNNSYGIFSPGDDYTKIDVNKIADIINEVGRRYFKINDENENQDSDELAISIYCDDDDIIDRNNELDIAFNFPATMLVQFEKFSLDLARTLREETANAVREYYNKYDFYWAREGESKEDAVEGFIKKEMDVPFMMRGSSLNYFRGLLEGKTIKEMMDKYGEDHESMFFSNLEPHFTIEGTSEKGKRFSNWYQETFGGSTGVSKDKAGFKKMSIITAGIFVEENPELKAKAERLIDIVSSDNNDISNEKSY